jgi:hypothetical protein
VPLLERKSFFLLSSLDEAKRKLDGVEVWPWKSFLSALWRDTLWLATSGRVPVAARQGTPGEPRIELAPGPAGIGGSARLRRLRQDRRQRIERLKS